MIDISWDLLSSWSRNLLVCTCVRASMFFFLTEMKIELFNLALAIWIFFVRKVLFQVLVFGFISHTPWFGHKTRDNHTLLCYAFKNSYFWLILFLLTENQNVLDWNPMQLLRKMLLGTNKLGNCGRFNASRLFHLNFFK